MIIKRFLLTFVIIITPLALAHGAVDESVVVSPSKIEITANPGETARREFIVTNKTDENLNLTLRFENLAAAAYPLDGAILAEDKTPIFPLTLYLSASERSFTLSSKGRVTVPVIIDLPKNVSPGGYYSAAVLSITSAKGGDIGTRVVTRLAPLIFLRVAGPVTEAGTLLDFTLIGSRFHFSAKPPIFYLTYQNTGAVYLNPYGLIKNKNQITGRQSDLAVDPWFVLPGTTRIREIKAPETLASGWYQATLSLNHGYGSSTSERLINFVVITPLVLVMTGLVLLVGLFIIIRRLITMGRSGKILLTFLTIMTIASLAPKVWAAVAASTNYRLQDDSLSFGGILSSSANYKLEDTAGGIGTGNLSSTNYSLLAGYQQMIASTISITAPADATLSTIDNSGTSNSSVAWTVITDNSAGYTLSIKASTNPALTSGSNSFSDYAPSGAVPDYTWSIAASGSAFGFSPEGADIASRYLNSGTTCGVGATDTTDQCWDGLSTTDRTIAQNSSANTPGGAATTVKLRAEIGSSKTQATGSYSTTLTATAMPR